MNRVNPKELRIGNWIFYEGSEYQMHDVNMEFPSFDTTEFGIYATNWNSVRGIRLSQDWLDIFQFSESGQKQGFTGRSYGDKIITYFSIATPFTLGEWQESYVFPIGDNNIVQLKYVHQLQNLFLDITRIELK
jgi:hypothetical protein